MRFSADNRLVIALALVVLLLAAMALTSATAPELATTSAGEALGQTGFAYAGGLRRFAAAVLWNRLEPLFHEYYEGVALADQLYMLPTIRMVITLDPQFEQAYYVAAWIVRARVGDREGIALARDGLENNPRSGLMHSNLLQLLYLFDRPANRPEIARLTDGIVGGTLDWRDDEERFEALAIARDVLLWQGEAARAQIVAAELERLRESGIGLGDHDHDGDGKQDH